MRRNLLAILIVAIVTLSMLSGCGLGQIIDTLTQDTPTFEYEDDSEKPVAATVAPTREPVPSPTLQPVVSQPLTDAGAVYQRVSPSIVYIDTPTGTGSGIIYQGGYVVTNAHVIWPFEHVRVVLPDGTEFTDTPVIGTDPMIDLAVLGPIDTSVPVASFAGLGDLRIGDTVYLVGYPGESDEFPRPALTQGLVSLTRNWEREGINYIQSDAAIAGGQSGGALVAPSGDVIGISGFSFSDVFALVASAEDLVPAITELINGGDPSGLSQRNNLLTTRPLYDDAIELGSYWDTQAYVIDQPLDTSIEISLDGRNDGAMTLVDSYGDVGASADENTRGSETLTGSIEWSGPYFLIVEQYTEGPGSFSLDSNVALMPIEETDDMAVIEVDSDTIGNIDYPTDIDVFQITLREGQTIVVTVDSVMIDGYLTIDYPGATESEIEWDDDSGYGVFGLNASTTYTAPRTGIFYLVVEDAAQIETGGYHLVVQSEQ